MRALLALMIIAPTWAVAEPCEQLITAICPDTVKRTKCVEFVAERIVIANEKALTAEERAGWCAAKLADPGAVDKYAGMMLVADKVSLELTVTVKATKSDGKAWDAGGGAPDLAACFTIDGETNCLPNGTSPERVKSPACPDSLACTFKLDARRGAKILVEVVDVDAMSNDRMGQCPLDPRHADTQCMGRLRVEAAFPH